MRRCFLLFLGLWIGIFNALAYDAITPEQQEVARTFNLSSTPQDIYIFSQSAILSGSKKSTFQKHRPKSSRFIYSTQGASFILGANLLLGFDDYSFNRNPNIDGFVATQFGGQLNLGLKVGDIWRLTLSPGVLGNYLSDYPSYVKDFESTSFVMDIQTSFDFVHFKRSSLFLQLAYQYEYQAANYQDLGDGSSSGLGNIYDDPSPNEGKVESKENKHKVDVGLGFRLYLSRTSFFHISCSWHVWEDMGYKKGWGLNPYPFSVVGFSFAL